MTTESPDRPLRCVHYHARVGSEDRNAVHPFGCFCCFLGEHN